jgi:hypothetical protein
MMQHLMDSTLDSTPSNKGFRHGILHWILYLLAEASSMMQHLMDSTPDSTPSSKSFRHDAASYGFYTEFYTFQQKLPAWCSTLWILHLPAKASGMMQLLMDSTPSSKSFRHDAASCGFYTGFYTF